MDNVLEVESGFAPVEDSQSLQEEVSIDSGFAIKLGSEQHHSQHTIQGDTHSFQEFGQNEHMIEVASDLSHRPTSSL
ncbi:hypothetical protein V6N11_075530 [Hibiscus sabdariffa]|uniref:Uncharacterized protein n=1 Tax=Hibiscus sabdariffa TaxID=183260 RepID=A0ABR2R6S0_9ROSI